MDTLIRRRRIRIRGFTLIELVVVMALLGLLLSMALPRYMASLARGREQVLVHNLAQLREAIDRYRGDRGAYPDRLDDLVERRYLRAVPLNPMSDKADWLLLAPPPGQKGLIYDVNAPGVAAEATAATVPEPAASEAQP
jgi:general secretion pathway protein G